MTDEAKKYMYQGLVMGLKNNLEPDEFLLNNFEDARKSGTLISCLTEIESLNEKMNRSEDFGNFVNDFFEKIKNVESVLYSDTYFRTNTQNSEFLNCLNGIKEQFRGFSDFVGAYKSFNTSNEILADNEALRKEAQKQRVGIKLDKNLSPLEKTLRLAEANALYGDRSDAVKEYIEVRNKQEKKSEEFLNLALKGIDKGAFLETCRLNINNLDSLSKNLAIADPETRDKLGATIRELRDVLIRFRNEYLSYEAKYNEILHQIGFKKSESSKEEIEKKVEELEAKINDLDKAEKLDEVVEESPVVEPVKPTPSPTPQPLEPVAEPEKTTETVNITTDEELAKEMKLLNSHLEISTDEKGFIDGIIYDGESKLVLPKGFSYDKVLGINNKVDDKTPYISLPVKVKEKIKTADEPSKQEELVEPTKSSKETRRVEPGKKYKVKKIRRAVVAPYVKSVLGFTGLGVVLGIAAGVGVSPLLPIAAVGASIGAIGQKIYNKMAANGMVDKENQDKRENDPNFEEDVWGLAAIDALITKGKNLFKNLKQAKERKNAEPQEEQPVETPVKPEPVVEEQKEETLDTPSENQNFEEVFNKRINEIFAEPEQAPVLPNINGEVYPLGQEESKGGR